MVKHTNPTDMGKKVITAVRFRSLSHEFLEGSEKMIPIGAMVAAQTAARLAAQSATMASSNLLFRQTKGSAAPTKEDDSGKRNDN